MGSKTTRLLYGPITQQRLKKNKNLCYKKKLSAENISKLSKVVLIYNWSGFHDIHSITPLVVEVLFLPAAVAGPGFFNLQGEEIS